MRPWLLVCLLLAGCAESPADPAEPAAPDEAKEAPRSTGAGIDNVTGSPHFETLIEQRVAIAANVCNPSMQQHDDMFTFDVVAGTGRLWANVTRIEQPPGLFATNIRLYDATDDLVDQEAWSGQGDMRFILDGPATGTWTVRLLHCDLPQGQHVIDSVVQVRIG